MVILLSKLHVTVFYKIAFLVFKTSTEFQTLLVRLSIAFSVREPSGKLIELCCVTLQLAKDERLSEAVIEAISEKTLL